MKITRLFAATLYLSIMNISDSESAEEGNKSKSPESSIAPAEIDWNRAKVLNRKSRAGEKLSAEDQAYLDRALKIRAGQKTGTAGDGSQEKQTVPPVAVPADLCPVRKLTARASDGRDIEVAYRIPPGDGPFPAIVFFHGGMSQNSYENLHRSALTNSTHTRFLAAGYVSVSASYRTYDDNPRSRGPILDATAIVRAVKDLPRVEPGSVAVFGGSGGGSIVLELAGEPQAKPVAVIAGEPATVIYTGMLPSYAERGPVVGDPHKFYSEEVRERTEKKIAAITSPILIHHGDQHALKIINFEIVFPAIEKAGKTLVVKKYPGNPHGFYWGNRTTAETLDKLVRNTREFLEPLLKAKPTPIKL